MTAPTAEYNTHGDLPLSPKQIRTIALSDARVNVWSGAIRSGKTFASSLRWLTYLADPPKGGQFVMVGRTRDSIARNVIAPMQDEDVFGDLANHVHYTSGAPIASILGKRVYIMGASDSKAEKAIRGMTLAGAYIDEVTIQSEEFFTQLLGRMSVPGAKAFVTTNPDNPAHWFKKQLDRIGQPGGINDWRSWFFKLEDNPSLTNSYKRAISAEYTGLFYKRFILGQWVAAAGAVYDMWDPAAHVVQHEELPPMRSYYAVGIDYGTTNATAATLLGMDGEGTLYAVDEWVYKPSSKEVRKTDVQLSEGLLNWLKSDHDVPGTRPDNVPLVVDPAAASFRVQLMADGTPTTAGNNDVVNGIRTVSALLSAGRLKVSTRCPNLIGEFPGYTWDPKATEKGEDAVMKVADHCIAEGTPVTTERGQVPIEQVTTSDRVLTRGGYQRVTRAWQTSPSADVLTLTTSNGHTLTGTGEHRIWTENRGWTRLDELTPDDTALTWDHDTPAPAHVVSVIAEPEPVPVYDLTVENHHEFIAAGVLVHNCLDSLRYAVVTTEALWRYDQSRLTQHSDYR